MAQQRAAAALAQQLEAAKKLTPLVKNGWQRFRDTNAQFVDKEAPPSVLAKRLVFTSLATCVAPGCSFARAYPTSLRCGVQRLTQNPL
jgi:hypothetical protein